MTAVLSSSAAQSAAKRYLDARECGARYGFSWRHWLRLVDGGKAPQPVRFGRLVRWPLASLEEWEAGGCRPIRAVKGRGA